jgi:protein-L-isoaspartate(D-aspartate) O-methyltransferase
MALTALSSALLACTAVGCEGAAPVAGEAEKAGYDEAQLAGQREWMVVHTIVGRGVKDPRTLAAMRKVPRHLFVRPDMVGQAYADHPLPIGQGQTISQPYIVAFMTEALGLRGGETVLEVGTGCGYQAAVLAELAAKVYTIEIIAPLAEEARERLRRLGYANVEVRAGDGYRGWPEAAPFDATLVTASAPRVPQPLKEQLKDGGRMILPVGDDEQDLVLVTRRGGTYSERRVLPVRFVPMTGEIRQ